MHLACSHPLKENMALSNAHSTVFHIFISAMFISDKISKHNLHSNMPHRLSTAHALHSFCIQDWSYSPCSVATALQPSTTYLTSHAHQHVLYTQHYPPPPPMHTTNTRHSYLQCIVTARRQIKACLATTRQATSLYLKSWSNSARPSTACAII